MTNVWRHANSASEQTVADESDTQLDNDAASEALVTLSCLNSGHCKPMQI